jgi:hypothetical protein
MAISPTLGSRDNSTKYMKADINDIMLLIYMGTTVGNIIEMFKHSKSGGKEKEDYLITLTRSIKLFYCFCLSRAA